MILDYQALFFDNARIGATATTTYSEVLDLGLRGPEIPRLVELFDDSVIYVQVTGDDAEGGPFAGTATYIELFVEVADDTGFTVNFETVAVGVAVPKADLVPGFNHFGVTHPREFNQRYMRIRATGDDTFETSGRLTAGIVLTKQTNR